MTKKMHRMRWLAALCLLCTTLLSGTHVLAQANYLSIFGSAGCGGPSINRMSANVTPTAASFTEKPDIADDWASSYGGDRENYFKNSVYDNAGNLLFSVNANGVYAPSGTQNYIFEPNTDSVVYVTPDGTTDPVLVFPGQAISEIVIIPVPGNCHAYYAIFWAQDLVSYKYELRAITIAVNKDTYPADGSITCRSNVISDSANDEGNYTRGSASTMSPFKLVIAADEVNPDGSRDIYTSQPFVDSGCSKMRKWTIAPDGTLPITAYTYFDHRVSQRFQMNAYGEKAKIINIGGTKYFTYIAGRTGAAITPSGAFFGFLLNGYTLNDATSLLATPSTWSPILDQDHYQINGFEYVPSKNVIYFSYLYYPSPSHNPSGGGLGYFSATGTTTFSSDSTVTYACSDLELTKKGDLAMVYGRDPVTTNGRMAYLNVSDAGFTPSATITPTVVSTSCSTFAYIPVKNHIEIGHTGTSKRNYYLGSQIRGENYNNWGADVLPAYTVSGNEVWSSSPSSHNPVANASGTTVSTISFAKDIIIPAGASLTIQGMTVKMAAGSRIIVEGGTSGPGGRLVLDNATVTSNTGGCDNPAWNMWRGIRIHGDPAASQNPSNTKQGKLTMINNSEISYADTAVITIASGGSFFIAQGGGIVQASNSRFINNHHGVFFSPFTNTNSSGTVINNTSYFHSCRFDVNDGNVVYPPPGSLSSPKMYHIAGFLLKGVSILGCDFDYSCHVPCEAVAIMAWAMGFTVSYKNFISYTYPSSFRNFSTAIWHTGSYSTHTAVVRNSIFENNDIGIRLDGSNTPSIVSNTFKIPYLGTAGPVFDPFVTPVRSIGVFLNAANMYNVYLNTFQINTASGIIPWGVDNTTVGVLAKNTGPSSNLIRNNTYKGLGSANLADGENRYGLDGLWYRCNTNTDNQFDIAVRGDGDGLLTSDPNDGDGIPHQGVIEHGIYRGSYYPKGCTSGNIFSNGDVCNLYYRPGEAVPFEYYYSSTASGGVPENQPTLPGVTGSIDGGVTPHMLDTGNTCDIESFYGGGGEFLTHGGGPIDVSSGWLPDVRHTAITHNIAHYMNDEAGVIRRDSLYYWLRELGTIDATKTTAYLLLEDTLVDSAYTIYTSIPGKHQLEGRDSVMYGDHGLRLFMGALYKTIRAGAPTTLFSTAVPVLDTMSDSTFTALLIEEVIDVFHKAKGWPRIEAENLIMQYSRSLYDSLLTEMPDTLKYPVLDTLPAPMPSPRGVLAVTELSQGPAADCQYAEIIVANCATNTSSYVDIRGWIIDDLQATSKVCANSNNDKGHFRLPYDATWENVPIGSLLVVYNGNNNCYALPDSFRLDTFNSVYYIPVGGSGNNHFERFTAEENDICVYCSDTGITVYDTASVWTHAYLDTVTDGIQVVCPGCSSEEGGAPGTYFAAGYLPYEADPEWKPEAMGTYSVGTVIMPIADSFGRYKYVFKGANADDLLDPANWEISATDTSGPIPPTIGKVGADLFSRVIAHGLHMPCCGVEEEEEHPEGKAGNSKNITTKQAEMQERIAVYPNPARSELNFRFPANGEVLLKLSDITGRAVMEQTVLDKGTAIMNVKELTPGMYMFHIVTRKQTYTGKVAITD